MVSTAFQSIASASGTNLPGKAIGPYKVLLNMRNSATRKAAIFPSIEIFKN